jgi:phage I-like protein
MPKTLAPAPATALSRAVAFRASGAQAGLPERVKILDWGVNEGRTTGARILVDDQSAALVPQYHAALGLDKVLLDYEHQSHAGHPNFKPDPRAVPGHGTLEIVPGEGVFLSAISYTPDGQAHAANYADVSAVAHLDAQGRLLYVSSVALTQYGDVAGLPFAEHVAALAARHATTLPPEPPPQPQNKKPTMDAPNYRELLIAALGVKPDDKGEITDEAIAAAAAAKAEKEKTGPDDATPPADATTVEALSARLDRLERERLIRDATAAGKVIPLSAATLATMAPATVAELLEKLPANSVPLSTTRTPEKPDATRAVALSAEQATAAAALGLSPEDYAKGKVG